MNLREIDGIAALVDLVLHPREAVKGLWSGVLHAAFAVVAIPVGCLAWAGSFLVGVIVVAGATLIFHDERIFGYVLIPWIFISLVPAFLAIVWLYRRLPRKIRTGIEIEEPVDVVPDRAPDSLARYAPGRADAPGTPTRATVDLAALDAKLAAPGERAEVDPGPSRPGEDPGSSGAR